MKKLKTFTKLYIDATYNIPDFLVIAFAIFVSLASWAVFYTSGLTTAYGDAMSHLNLSRFVFDNLRPGLTQLGGVWLPLTHILPLLFIWNDWAWHSGAAGSIFSMISYVVCVWAIFQIVYILTSHRLASLAGAIAFGLNLNIMYLQSTPLTEVVFLVFFILSVLFFSKWLLNGKVTYLLLIGVFGFFQVLTRYDAWFIVAVEGFLIGWVELFVRRKVLSEVIGKLFVMGAPIAFGIILWLLWNLIIFGDPLFFAIGPYSAHAQQALIATHTTLITKGNLFISTLAYWYAIVNNVGYIVVLLSIVGLAAVILTNSFALSLQNRIILLVFLCAPIIFNVLALFLGFSILNLPELGWNPSGDPGSVWFNVRYGIFALPLTAVFIGIFASRRRFITSLLAIQIVILQMFFMLPHNIITVIDGTRGSSSFSNMDVAEQLRGIVVRSDRVLLSMSFFNPVAFESGISLVQVVHEGVGNMWSSALDRPSLYANIIVMANGNVGDPVYQALVIKNKERFLKDYRLVYRGKHANIYQLHSTTALR